MVIFWYTYLKVLLEFKKRTLQGSFINDVAFDYASRERGYQKSSKSYVIYGRLSEVRPKYPPTVSVGIYMWIPIHDPQITLKMLWNFSR